MSAPKTDNIDIKKPADLDDRTGVFENGAWRYFNNFAEANAKPSIANYKSLGLTIPMVSNGIVVNFWLRDALTTWRRKTQYVGKFNTLALLQAAFNGTDPVANPDTTPEQGLRAFVGNTPGTPLLEYLYDGLNNIWEPNSPDLSDYPTRNEVVAFTPENTADILPGETVFVAATRDAVTGMVGLNTTTKSLSIVAPPTVDDYLSGTAFWGNVPGMGAEFAKFTGNNLTGGLGEKRPIQSIGAVLFLFVQIIQSAQILPMALLPGSVSVPPIFLMKQIRLMIFR